MATTAVRCLVVDDDAAIRTLLTGFLQQHGMVVEALASGTALRQRLQHKQGPGNADVLVLDLMLLLSGIVRSDIRSSIGGATGTAAGVPLTLALKLVNTNGSCASLAGYAIYLWHCDALGRYSMYSSGITAESDLRGVQVTDANGSVSFTTIFPGCYSGRVPHIHFEVYRSSTTASSWTNKLKTSQLTFPLATSQAVYAASGYTGSAANLAAISFASDNVFSDGVGTQLASIVGSNSAGYAASLQLGISV